MNHFAMFETNKTIPTCLKLTKRGIRYGQTYKPSLIKENNFGKYINKVFPFFNFIFDFLIFASFTLYSKCILSYTWIKSHVRKKYIFSNFQRSLRLIILKTKKIQSTNIWKRKGKARKMCVKLLFSKLHYAARSKFIIKSWLLHINFIPRPCSNCSDYILCPL